MRYLLLLLSGFFLPSAAEAAGFGGIYFMENPPVRILAKLERRGERVVGIIEFGGRARINLLGVTQDNLARGSATSRDGAGAFEAQVEGDTLSITITQVKDRNQRADPLSLVMQRSDLSTAGPAEVIREWLITGLTRISALTTVLRVHLEEIRCSAGTDPSCTKPAGRPPAEEISRPTGAMKTNASMVSGARKMAIAGSVSRTAATIK